MTARSRSAGILFYLLLVLLVFLSRSLKFDILLLASTALFSIGIPLSVLRRGALPISFVLMFTFIINSLFHPGRVIFEFGGTYITMEGVSRGLHLTLRIAVLILGAKILSARIPAGEIVPSIVRLLGPLGKWKPAREFIATLELTVRFLPLVVDEAKTLYGESAHRFHGTGFAERLKTYASLVAPLFERSVKKAKEMQSGS